MEYVLRKKRIQSYESISSKNLEEWEAGGMCKGPVQEGPEQKHRSDR